MNDALWELGCAPRELHQKDIDIFGGPQPQQHERKTCGTREGQVACDKHRSGVRSN